MNEAARSGIVISFNSLDHGICFEDVGYLSPSLSTGFPDTSPYSKALPTVEIQP